MSISNFSAEAFDSGTLLRWNTGAGSNISTTSDSCEITLQYSITGVANIVPNTPPYAVRQLKSYQLVDRVFWHPNLVNGTSYIYSIFVHYLDTGEWKDPIITGPVTPIAGVTAPFTSGSLSFSKLGTNTVLSSGKVNTTEIVTWLPDGQEIRKAIINNVLRALKPAHTELKITYEPYYVAQTTTEQFTSGSYNLGSYEVVEGTIKNKIPTIDYSFSGRSSIFGG